jgi:hypothetical protein
MAFQRSVIIAVGVSLCAGFLSFFLFRPSAGGFSYGGYGALSVDQACPDRTVGAALVSAGIKTYFSESTQWAYLDDFGELVRVPLDEYSGRLEPFDPRNDGYAEKLRAFFVRDGTRRFFIPLAPLKRDVRKTLTGGLDAALGDIPYTLEFPVPNRPFSRYAVLFAVFGAAVLFSLFLPGPPFPFLALIPLCAPLVFLGYAGMVLTGLLFAFSGSLVPPLGEFFLRFRREGSFSRFRKSRGLPVSSCCSYFMPLLFAVFYGAVLLAGKIPVPSALLVFLSCCGVTGAVLWAESGRGGHVRFRPAPIKKPSVTISTFFRYFKRNCPRAILPWVPAAGLALVLSFLPPEPGMGLPAEGGPAPDAGDYEAHLVFQRSFSLRPLEDAGKSEAYPEYLPYFDYYRYSIGDDGLVTENLGGAVQAGSASYRDSEEFFQEFPPFPLEDLTAFLEGYAPPVNSVRTFGDFILILFILIPSLPFLIRFGRKERKGGSSLVLNDKRIAA